MGLGLQPHHLPPYSDPALKDGSRNFRNNLIDVYIHTFITKNNCESAKLDAITDLRKEVASGVARNFKRSGGGIISTFFSSVNFLSAEQI